VVVGEEGPRELWEEGIKLKEGWAVAVVKIGGQVSMKWDERKLKEEMRGG